jgi:hypothetical protein
MSEGIKGINNSAWEQDARDDLKRFTDKELGEILEEQENGNPKNRVEAFFRLVEEEVRERKERQV